jgi:hypothetical protein
MTIIPQGWQLGPDILGDSDDDTALLRGMYQDALDYIAAFDWAPPIKSAYLAVGIGGVVGLFFVEFDIPIDGTDDKLWVVVGDLPSAYFVIDNAADSAAALKVYCELMAGWADAVDLGESLSDVFPISVPPTKSNAQSLRKRIGFLQTEIIPAL